MHALLVCTSSLLLMITLVSSDEVLEVHIIPESESGNCTCTINDDFVTCCRSLDQALQRFHSLTQPIPIFQDLNSVKFEGNHSIIACQQPLIGLAFVNISNLYFYDVMFKSCGALRNSTSKYFDRDERRTDKFKVAVYFESSSNIYMEKVVITSSPNATGMVIYDASGDNIFKDCEFCNNSVDEFYDGGNSDDEIGGGGGGVYVELTYCQPGRYCDYSDTAIDGAFYTFLNCNFINNKAKNWRKGGFIYPYKMNHQAFGRGGGLSLYIKGNNSNITFLVDGCTFDNNVALWGGGFLVELNDLVQGNKILINSTKFLKNSSPIVSSGAGGGLRLAHYIYESVFVSNSFLVENSTFMGNWAINGGGLALSWARQPTSIAEFTLSNLKFENNWGRLGSALFIEQFWKVSRHNGVEAVLNLINCIFFSNSDKFNEKVQEEKDSYEVGVGAMYISSSSITFNGSVTFENNEGSALAVSDSTVLLEDCIVIFANNEGSTGAGIALLGTSTLDIGKGTEVFFINNTALIHGGAIFAEFVSRQTRISDPNCFIRYTDPFVHSNEWNVSMTFIGNWDHGGTKLNSIHATSILPCTDTSTSDRTESIAETFCWRGWKYYINNTDFEEGIISDCENHISSDIGNIILTDKHKHAIPGWQFDLPVKIVDDLDADLKNDDVLFKLKLVDNNNVSTIQYCKKNVTIMDYPHNIMEFILTSAGDRLWSTDINITLNDCPMGFILNFSTLACVCNKNYGIDIDCDDKTKIASIAKNIWLGRVNDNGYYYKADCPYHYCSVRERVYTKLLEGFEMCGYNRTGIICGECKEGHGPAVNSPDYECIECKDHNGLFENVLKYFSVVYLPLFFFFMVIIIFDIRLTTGPANAFILYSQLITTTFSLDANGGILIDDVANIKAEQASLLMNLYKIPYDIFNLNFIANFIPSICFSTEMNTLSVLCLEYGVAFFPLAMIIFTITLLKLKDCCCSICVNRNPHSKVAKIITRRMQIISNSLLPAFAAFVLLSYTKFSTVSSNLMRTIDIGDNNRRMHLAGQYDHTTREYKVYSYIGITVFAIFVALTSILLLDFPLRALEYIIMKSTFVSSFYPATKIHILLDTFQGCYKKNTRFFAGLYFLCRLGITLSYVYSETWVQRFVIQQITVTVILVLLALCRPYHSNLNFVNYVDILIFSLLAVFNCVSFYLYLVYKSEDPDIISSEFAVIFYLQYIAVFFPLIYMTAFIIWHFKNRGSINLRCDQLSGHDSEYSDSNIFDRAAESFPQPASRISGKLSGSETDALLLLSSSESYKTVPLRRSIVQKKNCGLPRDGSRHTKSSGMI